MTEKLFVLELLYGSPMSVMSDCVRGFLKAKKGHDLIGCDFSSIEARVLAWLAGQEDKLEIFKGHGKIYEHAASRIYGVPIEEVTKDQRLIGKVSELALGYQGGVGAFQSMAKVYFVKVPDSQANDIKVAWRSANPHIQNYWYGIEDTAMWAVRNPGKSFAIGAPGREVTFKKAGSFLWALLPSGRVLCYPYPEIQTFDTPWGEPKEGLTYKTVVLNKWGRTKTYGGKLTENVTQAVARDCLAEALPKLEEKGYSIVMHVHDEAVLEVPKHFGSVEEVEEIMTDLPPWTKGLPVAAEGWRGERFRK